MKFLSYIKEVWSVVKGELDDIYLYELLTRKASDKDSYIKWLHSLEKEQMLNYLFQEYKLSVIDKEDRSMIRFFNSRHTMGFMLRYPETTAPQHFQHLFDHLKVKTEQYSYFVTISDRKIFQRRDSEEIVERYLLQHTGFNEYHPVENHHTSGQFDSVCIELFKVEGQYMYLRFNCKNSIENHCKHLIFERLLAFICEKEMFREEEVSHLHNLESGNL